MATALEGFKKFLLRGNLVELAVAVIIGTSFAAVVKAFTDVLMGFIGKIGGQPDFSQVEIAGVNVGNFINAVIAFVILAAVVYFFVILPYEKAKERLERKPEEAPVEDPAEVALLKEIRDLLSNRSV